MMGIILRFSAVARPVSRKSRKTGDDNSNLTFQEQARKCISDVKIAFEPLESNNSPFHLTKTEDQVSIDVGVRGKFIFTIDYHVSVINYQSPISGVFQYSYNKEDGNWLCTRDLHDMRGMATRDWIRHGSGYPKFN